MSIYDERPWLSRYDQDQPTEISPEFTDSPTHTAARPSDLRKSDKTPTDLALLALWIA